MPKKKKNGQSPSRAPWNAAEYGGSESRAPGPNGSIVTRPDSSYSNFGSTQFRSGQLESQSRDEIIQNMQEMFSHLDPEVIYMVLSEADFKVDNAMDSLLELSDAAEVTPPPPPPVSGFEQAAALLGTNPTPTNPLSGTAQSFAFSNQPASQAELSPTETHLTEEFDALLDQELQTLTLQQTQTSSHPAVSSIPLSSLPPPSQSIPLSSLTLTSQTQLPATQTLPEQADQYSDPGLDEARGGSSPVNELSFGGVHMPETNTISLDFSHLTLEATSAEPRPSAFQVYRRPEQLRNHTAPKQHQEALRTPAMFWNTQATEFHPRAVGPAFITPVIPNPTPWNSNPIPASQWLARGPIRQAPLKPSATVPESWTLPPRNRLKLEGQLLVLLRGAPGSGKTTLAKRTRHQVTKEKIRRILERYDRFVSVQSIMNSQRPEPVPSIVDSAHLVTEQPQQSLPPGLSHPDLVGDSGLSKLNTNLSSSLPDVSSVSQTYSTISTGEEEGETGSYSSKESVLFHENIPEGSGTPQSDLLDAEGLDLELDACLVDTEKELGNLSSGTTEEFVVSAHETYPEPPVAFSESIAQRVRRDRVKDRSALGTSAIDQPVNFDPSVDSTGEDKEEGCEGESLSEDKVRPELLDFVGDWPLESQGQRQGRRKNKSTVLESSAVEHKDNTFADEDKHSDTDKLNTVEFQKLVDLLQCGIHPPPGSYQSPAPSERATLHFPSFGEKEGNVKLETVVWPELPDCVLERTFPECTDPCKDYSNSSSPLKPKADPTEQSSQVSAEKITQDEVEQEDNVLSEDKCSSGVFVLKGNSLRFTPKTNEQESACQQAVPYRVVHEKGSQVEENDFRESNSKKQNLEILHRHFRRVSIDILEDLYEKCHQDMEWTTNLLLDSGERLYKEDDEDEEVDLGSLVPKEESCEPSIEPPTVTGSESVQARPVFSDDFSNSSASSISPKSQETNLSDVSQADDDWSPGQSSQSEAEGSDVASMDKTKATEGAEVQLEVTAANEQQTDNTGQQGPEQEEALVTQGAFSPDDCAVQIDLNLAKLLHQKWKETIQEKHRQAALSYQLMQESPVHWGESQESKTRLRDQLGSREEIPFMDHWSASYAPVSLRDIMIEEQVMQDSMEKSRSSRRDLDKKDGAAKLKENQLFSMFPTIDRHFLRDIFRDHNYSLEQTEQFLHALLDDGPVKNVVAPEPAPQRNGAHRAPSKERKWKPKDGEVEAAQFQDSEDPEYEDFRTEATLQRRQQIECFNKAAEAHRQGRKDVASFYAQQLCRSQKEYNGRTKDTTG
ncbi:NEDD4-binding 2 [Labeo rohita]|uniref:NEDD4-binding 2 n=1 Tax=Labeo rohita TaxID=84645 RepID=A0A498N985_LABRO|nr:NEDD4-binding 2 [Labeo rohita]